MTFIGLGPPYQAFSQSLACNHNPSDIGRLVDLWPMPRFKDMNRSIAGLRSHVLGDDDMKIGVDTAFSLGEPFPCLRLTLRQ